MTFRAQHPIFGEITFDGQNVTVERDSLSKTLTDLMRRQDDWPELGIGVGEYTGGPFLAFGALLDSLGLQRGLTGIRFDGDSDQETRWPGGRQPIP